jgi:hypothetical protein
MSDDKKKKRGPLASGASAVPNERTREMLDALSSSPEVGNRTREMAKGSLQRELADETFKNLTSKTKGVSTGLSDVDYEAERARNKATELDRARDETLEGVAVNALKAVGSAAWTPIGWALEKYDQLVPRQARRVSAYARGLKDEDAQDPNVFHTKVESQRKSGNEPDNLVVKAENTLRDFGGEVGHTLGMLAELPGAVFDPLGAPRSVTEIISDQKYDNSRAAAGKEIGSRVAFDIATDPTTYVGLGPSKQGIGNAARGLTVLDANGTRRALTEAERAAVTRELAGASQSVVIPQRQKAMERAAQITSADPKVADDLQKQIIDAFGETGARLDRRPITFAGVDVSERLLGPVVRKVGNFTNKQVAPNVISATQVLDEGVRSVKAAASEAVNKVADSMDLRMNPYQRGVPRTETPTLSPYEKMQIAGISDLSQAAGQATFRERNRVMLDEAEKVFAKHRQRVEAYASANPGVDPKQLNQDAYNMAAKAVMDVGYNLDDARWVQAAQGTPEFQIGEQFANDLRGLLKPRERTLKQHGVGLTFNKMTGDYYPRNANAAADELNYDILQNILNVQPDVLPKHGGAAPNFKPRNQRSVPLGQVNLMPGDPGYQMAAQSYPQLLAQNAPVPNPAFLRPVDMPYDIGTHTFQVAQLEGFKEHIRQVERMTGKPFHLMPEQLKRDLVASYPAQYEGLRHGLDVLIGEAQPSAAKRIGGRVVDTINNAWRRVVLPLSAQHNMMNTVGDITTGLQTTVDTPAIYKEAANFIDRAEKGLLTAAEKLDFDYARQYGLVDSNTLQRLDLPGSDKAKNVLHLRDTLGEDIGIIARTEQKAGRLRSKAPGWVPIGSSYGDWWEPINKVALFLNARKRGLGPEQAVKEALTVGINYNKPLPFGMSGYGPQAKAQQLLFPFAKYAFRAPQAVASEFPGNMLRLTAPNKITRDVTHVSQDGRNEVDETTGKYGYALPLPTSVNTPANAIVDFVGGPSGNDTTIPYYLRIPQGGLDALEFPAKLAGVAQTAVDSGARQAGEELGKVAVQQMGPIPRAVFSALTGINPQAMEPRRADGLSAATLTANALGDYMLPRDWQYPANRTIEWAGGPSRTFGFAKQYDPTMPDKFIPWMASLAGMSMSRGDPMARLQDVVYSPNFEATQTSIANAKAKDKADKKRDDMERRDAKRGNK